MLPAPSHGGQFASTDDAWFVTRDNGRPRPERFGAMGTYLGLVSSDLGWWAELLRRLNTREWLQGLGSLGCAGLAKGIIAVPCLVGIGSSLLVGSSGGGLQGRGDQWMSDRVWYV